jgi:hypothetical protein
MSLSALDRPPESRESPGFNMSRTFKPPR